LGAGVALPGWRWILTCRNLANWALHTLPARSRLDRRRRARCMSTRSPCSSSCCYGLRDSSSNSAAQTSGCATDNCAGVCCRSRHGVNRTAASKTVALGRAARGLIGHRGPIWIPDRDRRRNRRRHDRMVDEATLTGESRLVAKHLSACARCSAWPPMNVATNRSRSSPAAAPCANTTLADIHGSRNAQHSDKPPVRGAGRCDRRGHFVAAFPCSPIALATFVFSGNFSDPSKALSRGRSPCLVVSCPCAAFVSHPYGDHRCDV
jgi:hypothetical protein